MKVRQVVLSCLFLVCVRGRAEQYDWVNRFEGDSSSGYTIGLDAANNVYVAGHFNGTLIIGTNQFNSAGGQDIFLAKLNLNGEPLWAMSAGGTNEDWAYRIAVTTNGTIFICGALSTGASFGTNALITETNRLSDGGGFVARIDDSALSWIDLFAPKSHGPAESLTLSKKDQSLWVIGEDGSQILIKSYSQDGTVQSKFFVGDPATVYTAGIAVDTNENIFITGSFFESLNLGITNFTGYGNTHFTAAMNSTGRVIWAWVAFNGYPSVGEALALTTDGAVISVGHLRQSDLPDQFAFIAKHSANGMLQWLQILGEFRGNYNATDVTVDANGYILTTGWAAGYFPDPANRYGVLLAVYDPNGNKLFEHHISSAVRADYNAGGGIACDATGNTVFTGYLAGTPKFGTNVLGNGPSGVANAFVARRPTLEPTLVLRRIGTNVTLSWPRTGMPFALQQTEDMSSTNWPDVPIPPEQAGERKQVTLAREPTNCFFRLKMTNEVPIRHLPIISDPLQVYPSTSFLGRYPVYVTGSNSFPSPVISAFASDEDDDDLTFEWVNPEIGQRLTNGISATWQRLPPDYNKRLWFVTLRDADLTFPVGSNTLSLVAFDGAFHATNSVTFEVLSLTNALDELIATVLAATTTSEGNRLATPLRSARDAIVTGQFDVASQQMQELQTRLQNSTELSDPQKALFNDAAQTILAAIPTG